MSLRARHGNARGLFHALDADRDGKVSQEEFGRALALLGLRSDSDVPLGTTSSPQKNEPIMVLVRPASTGH